MSSREPSNKEIQDCLFAWKVCKFVKSNAVVYAKDNQTVGVGAGQMSRIDSAQIAASKAKEMGFETYDDIFDESYDELETWEERTKAVWKEIEKVLTLSE